MKKLEKIIAHLEAVKINSPYPFKVWNLQDLMDLAQSGLKGDISEKTARKMIYNECTEHLASGCYDSAHSTVSEMCLPYIWK